MRDAGAEVVKIETSQGDPLRRWCSPGASEEARGALFAYLAAGKKSVLEGHSAQELFESVDLVITDLPDGEELSGVAGRVGERSAVVVGVTPFGCDGPYAESDVAANEFVLQALCGSIGGRGWPGEEPLQAGGRVGEWVAGTVAAVTAAACVRHARRTGQGEVVDVSTYEAMAMTMGALGAMAASVLGDDQAVTSRSLELPSIVPTADGLVGFCTITAQQFQDFLVMIDRADLLDDADLASFAGRIGRRDEFLASVHDWAATRTTEEIIEYAAALRIPVAPVATPRTVSSIDHFVARGVFREAPTGTLHPRAPYRGNEIATRPPAPPPELGADDGRVTWPARRCARSGSNAVEAGQLPLSGVRVADFTAFWAGPMATSVLAALGADVIKIEGVRRPDGMRFSGGRPSGWEQWWEWGPVFLCSNTNKRGITLELSAPRGRGVAIELISYCDLVIENFSPRVMANFDLEWDTVHAANPSTSMVRMPAFGLDGPWRDRVGFAQNMEQSSGMAWMTGPADGLPIVPRGVCDPIAGLHAVFAAIAALEIRDRVGHGVHVEATMVEAALNVAAEAPLESSLGAFMPGRDGNRGPDASPQGVFRCQGDDAWVAVAVLSDAEWPALATLIGSGELGDDPALQHEQGRRGRADEIDKLIAVWAAQRPVPQAVARLRECGVAAAPVTKPADLLIDDQLNARGFWEVIEHPVAGRFRTTGMPFKFASRRHGWIKTAAPLYGQHTREVLRGLLGKTDEEMGAMETDGTTRSRPAGL